MSILELIPVGSKNAVKRKDLLNICKSHGIANTDREMRRLIEKARSTSCVICLSDGRGYFIPDEQDQDKLRTYIKQESDRYKSVICNLHIARAMLEDLEYGRV